MSLSDSTTPEYFPVESRALGSRRKRCPGCRTVGPFTQGPTGTDAFAQVRNDVHSVNADSTTSG
jgi:hypothetical protein